MAIASVVTLFFVALAAPVLASDDTAPDLDAPLPPLEGEIVDDGDREPQEPTPPPSMGDAPPLIDALPPVDETGVTEALPPADENPGADEGDVTPPWPWSTTVGSSAGAAIPTVLFGGSGSVLGGCSLFLIGSGVAQGGCGGLVLVLYGIVVAVIAVPVLVMAALLTPIAAAIGALVGGAVDDRLAWQSAAGALLGFIPAFAALASAVVAYAITMNVGSLTPTQTQLAFNAILATVAMTMIFVLLTGPAAVGGGVLGEMFAERKVATGEDEFIETTPVDESEGTSPPPVVDDDEAPPVVDTPESAPAPPAGDEPPPMLAPEFMRF